MLVSLNGILQAPVDSFTVSGSTLTFASNLITGDVIDFVMILGNVLDLGVPSDNTVTTAKLADSSVSLAKLTATGTKDATTFLRGDNTFDTPPLGGITEFDMFRLTADQSGGTNGVISSNLERVDDATFQKIGTGMSESSGVYTFPSTGKYLVSLHAMVYAVTDANCNIEVHVSSDSGSNYDEIANINGGNDNGNASNSVSGQALVDVTNASTYRVRFETASMGASSYLRGSTSSNYTTFSFLRLGDT